MAIFSALALNYAVKTIFEKEKMEKMAKDTSAKTLMHAGAIVRKSTRESFGTSLFGEPAKEDEPPNIKTGRLKRSIRFEQKAYNIVWVGSGRKYASILELGLYYGNRVPAHPYLMPALQREYSRLPYHYRNTLQAYTI